MSKPTSSSTLDVNGIQLGYRDLGTGSPLVLLHGGFGSVEMFGPNLDLLAANFSPMLSEVVIPFLDGA
jgi:pimeloyl-ACP methyl ester carboxylesterase